MPVKFTVNGQPRTLDVDRTMPLLWAQTNFHQYRVLRLNEMPRVVEVHIVPSTNAPSGVGEPGTPPIAPAVANAVRAATGIKLHKLPFDLAAARSGRA
jgi:isoquinoline 1-oxidoreductase subunit beta